MIKAPVPLRFGLLGASWAGEHVVVQPARERSDVTVSVIAARDPARAERYAQTHGIPAIASDYAALISRDDVDIVYVGLTPSEHMRWTIRALQAGKHVLCEKPFAMNAREAESMVAAAKAHGRLLLEAWHYRFHPLMLRIESIVESGVLGRLRHAKASFHAPIPKIEEAFRWRAALGGGALLDTGGYTIHILRTLLRHEPTVRQATSVLEQGIDVRTQAVFVFGDELQAEIDCAMTGETLKAELLLQGEGGRLVVNGFALPQWGCELRLETAATRLVETSFPTTTYAAQLDHVVKCMSGAARPLTGGADAINNMRIIDAVRSAAAS